MIEKGLPDEDLVAGGIFSINFFSRQTFSFVTSTACFAFESLKEIPGTASRHHLQ
jgi:hypothetical protein